MNIPAKGHLVLLFLLTSACGGGGSSAPAVVVTPPVAIDEPATYVVTVQWVEVNEAAPVTFQLGFQT